MQSSTTALAPIEVKIRQTTIRLMQGDLTALPVDAFVFCAREDLRLGSGFGAAIQARGGDAIRKKLEQFGRLPVGEAVDDHGRRHRGGARQQSPKTGPAHAPRNLVA